MNRLRSKFANKFAVSHSTKVAIEEVKNTTAVSLVVSIVALALLNLADELFFVEGEEVIYLEGGADLDLDYDEEEEEEN